MGFTQRIPREVEIWCAKPGVSANPTKLGVIVFRRCYKWNGGYSSEVNANILEVHLPVSFQGNISQKKM